MTAPRADALSRELRTLRLKGLGNEPSGHLPKNYPLLANLAQSQPLEDFLARAVNSLSPRDLREAASILIGLSGTARGSPHALRQNMACQAFDPPPTVNTFRQQPRYMPRIMDSLRSAVLSLRSPVLAAHEWRESFTHVARIALENSALQLLGDTREPLLLWGEPGNGKTHLAHVLASILRHEHKPLLVRLGTSGGPATNVYTMDIYDALSSLRVGNESWSLAAQESTFRDLLATQGATGPVILDDVEPVTLSRLLPDRLANPVLVTSRFRIQSVERALLVPAYRSDQALAAATANLPDGDPQTLARMCDRLGRRPVAIHIATRVVRAGHSSLADLVAALEADLPATIDAAHSLTADLGRSTQSLVTLYACLRDIVYATPDAKRLLNWLLWLTEGTAQDESWKSALSDGEANASTTVRLTAAHGLLGDAGLITDEQGAVQMNSLSHMLLRHSCQEDMETTTRTYLGSLGQRMLESSIPRSILDVVTAAQSEADSADEQSLRISQIEMTIKGSEYSAIANFRDALGITKDIGAVCADRHTWIAWQKEYDWLSLGRPSATVTIEVRDAGVWAWASQTATKLKGVHAQRIYNWFEAYGHFVLGDFMLGDFMLGGVDPESRPLPDPDQQGGYAEGLYDGTARLRTGVSEPDGLRHQFLGLVNYRFASSVSGAGWTHCGLRIPFASAGDVDCAECRLLSTLTDQWEKLVRVLVDYIKLQDSLSDIVDTAQRAYVKASLGEIHLMVENDEIGNAWLWSAFNDYLRPGEPEGNRTSSYDRLLLATGLVRALAASGKNLRDLFVFARNELSPSEAGRFSALLMPMISDAYAAGERGTAILMRDLAIRVGVRADNPFLTSKIYFHVYTILHDARDVGWPLNLMLSFDMLSGIPAANEQWRRVAGTTLNLIAVLADSGALPPNFPDGSQLAQAVNDSHDIAQRDLYVFTVDAYRSLYRSSRPVVQQEHLIVLAAALERLASHEFQTGDAEAGRRSLKDALSTLEEFRNRTTLSPRAEATMSRIAASLDSHQGN